MKKYLIKLCYFVVFVVVVLSIAVKVQAARGIQDWQIAWGLAAYEVNASDNPTDTTSFNNNLSAADDNVQKAFDTLDDMSTGASTFLALTDTPGTYASQAGKSPVVNGGETALAFFQRMEFFSAKGDGVFTVDVNDQWINEIVGGEGIDTTQTTAGSTATLTVDGEDATTTNKGILETATDAEFGAASATDKALVPSNLPLTTEGDLFYHNGTILTRLALGSNGLPLVVDTSVVGKLAYKKLPFTEPIVHSDIGTFVATGTGLAFAYTVPTEHNGLDLQAATASNYIPGLDSGLGTTTINITRSRAGADVSMLSTGITISSAAYTASDGIINTSNDDIATGDMIFINVTAITDLVAATGLTVTLKFE